jgi:hypothetical protein
MSLLAIDFQVCDDFADLRPVIRVGVREGGESGGQEVNGEAL